MIIITISYKFFDMFLQYKDSTKVTFSWPNSGSNLVITAWNEKTMRTRAALSVKIVSALTT